MDVCVMGEKKICWLICAGMSDDWMIYSRGLYDKWIFEQKKKNMTTCCVYAMCTSVLVNDCEWFLQYSIFLFVLEV